MMRGLHGVFVSFRKAWSRWHVVLEVYPPEARQCFYVYGSPTVKFCCGTCPFFECLTLFPLMPNEINVTVESALKIFGSDGAMSDSTNFGYRRFEYTTIARLAAYAAPIQRPIGILIGVVEAIYTLHLLHAIALLPLLVPPTSDMFFVDTD
jgi:hypothetical protein